MLYLPQAVLQPGTWSLWSFKFLNPIKSRLRGFQTARSMHDNLFFNNFKSNQIKSWRHDLVALHTVEHRPLGLQTVNVLILALPWAHTSKRLAAWLHNRTHYGRCFAFVQRSRTSEYVSRTGRCGCVSLGCKLPGVCENTSTPKALIYLGLTKRQNVSNIAQQPRWQQVHWLSSQMSPDLAFASLFPSRPIG